MREARGRVSSDSSESRKGNEIENQPKLESRDEQTGPVPSDDTAVDGMIP